MHAIFRTIAEELVTSSYHIKSLLLHSTQGLPEICARDTNSVVPHRPELTLKVLVTRPAWRGNTTDDYNTGVFNSDKDPTTLAQYQGLRLPTRLIPYSELWKDKQDSRPLRPTLGMSRQHQELDTAPLTTSHCLLLDGLE